MCMISWPQGIFQKESLIQDRQWLRSKIREQSKQWSFNLSAKLVLRGRGKKKETETEGGKEINLGFTGCALRIPGSYGYNHHCLRSPHLWIPQNLGKPANLNLNLYTLRQRRPFLYEWLYFIFKRWLVNWVPLGISTVSWVCFPNNSGSIKLPSVLCHLILFFKYE